MQPDYQNKLASLRGRIRSVLAFQGLVYLAGALLVLVLIDMGADRLLRLDTAQRVLAGVVLLALLGLVAWRALLGPVSIPLSDEKMAVLVEHRFPELGDRLISALQFRRMLAAGKPISPALAEAVMQQAAEATARLPVDRLIDGRRLGLIFAACGACLLAAGGAGLAIPADAWSTWARRNLLFQAVEWPFDSRVELEGFDAEHRARVPAGDVFVLRARALRQRADGTAYVVPETVQISFRFGQGDWQKVEPRGKDGRYSYPLGAVFRPVELRVKAGDYTTPLHRISIARRPELAASGLAILPPSYTLAGKHAPAPHGAAGSVPVLVGSAVTLRGTSSKDLAAVQLLRNGKPLPGVRLSGQREFDVSLPTADPAKDSGVCKVVLRDTEGVTNYSAAMFTLVVEPDRLPAIRARPVGIGERITSVARIPLEVEVRDKYGLAEVGLRYELLRRPRPGSPKPQTVFGYIRLARFDRPGSKSIPLERFGLDLEAKLEAKRRVDSEFQQALPGDRVRVYIEASDHAPGQRKSRFPEQGFHFSIVPQTVLHGHLLDQQKRIRRQYSALIERQREIYWVLMRQKNMTEWKVTKDNATLLDRQGTEQRRLLRASLRLAEGIEQIREEMENNRLDRKGEMRQKLRTQVIGPMKGLADDRMTPFAAGLERMSRQLGARPIQALDAAIGEAAGIVGVMQRILLAMERSEVFDEVVTRLRSIIRLQQELRRLTEEARRKQLEGSLPEILGPPDKPDKDKKDK